MELAVFQNRVPTKLTFAFHDILFTYSFLTELKELIQLYLLKQFKFVKILYNLHITIYFCQTNYILIKEEAMMEHIIDGTLYIKKNNMTKGLSSAKNTIFLQDSLHFETTNYVRTLR